MKKNRIKIPCNGCGVEIEKTPSRLKCYKHHFCSMDCKKRWQSKYLIENHPNRKYPKEWICLNCKIKFPNKTGHPRKYCSTKCQMDYEYKTGKRDKFKTALKAQESRRKGNTHQNFRRRVFNFYPNVCVICGCTENLEAHHIIPQEYDGRKATGKGDHRVRNGIILCHKCHDHKRDNLGRFIKGLKV